MLGLLSSQGCNDDGTEDDASSGRGGSSSNTGGRAATTGGATATGGSTPAAGEGGEDSAGAPAAGQGGDGGGAVVAPWEDGVTANGLSEDVDDYFHGVTVDAEDRVLAVGYYGDPLGSNPQMVVARFDSKGQLDPDFGEEGMALFDFSTYEGEAGNGDGPDMMPDTDDDIPDDASVETARDVALQGDGKIIVVGLAEDRAENVPTRDTPVNILVMRLNTDGSLDDTFGTDGVTEIDAGTAELAWGVQVDGEDRVLVFGHGLSVDPARTDQDRFCWRLDAEGQPDLDFGTDGYFTFDAVGALNDNQRRGFALDDGSIVMAGYTGVGGRNQIVLVKLDDTGTPDPTFAGDGFVRIAPFPLGMAEAYGAGVLSDGSIVTTGYGRIYEGEPPPPGVTDTMLDMISVHVNATGDLAPGYGVGGVVAYDVAAGEDRGRAATALPDDRILFAGTGSPIPGDKNAMLLVLDGGGVPAEDFGAAGRKLYDFGAANEEFRSVVVAPSGNFVAAAGYSAGDTMNATLVVVPIPE